MSLSLCSLSSKIDALENKLQKGYETLQNEINENDDDDEKKPETQQVVCKHCENYLMLFKTSQKLQIPKPRML